MRDLVNKVILAFGLVGEKLIANPIKISVDQLAEILEATTRSTIISLVYCVDDSRSKVIQGQKQVQKVVEITTAFLNHDYTQKVLRLSGKTKFEAQPLKGKERVCGTLLRSLSKKNLGKLMIDAKVLKSNKAKILGYVHNGELISEANALVLDLWANSYFAEKKVYTKGRGLVSEEDDFAIVNTFLHNIKAIKIGGKAYEIV